MPGSPMGPGAPVIPGKPINPVTPLSPLKKKKNLWLWWKMFVIFTVTASSKIKPFFKKFTIHHLCSIGSLLPLLCFPFLPNLYVVVFFKLIHDSETIIQTHLCQMNHIQEDRVALVTPPVTLLHTSCFPYFPRASYFAERAADAWTTAKITFGPGGPITPRCPSGPGSP